MRNATVQTICCPRMVLHFWIKVIFGLANVV